MDAGIEPRAEAGGAKAAAGAAGKPAAAAAGDAPTAVKGRVWIVGEDNIDTDMIYHNSHLAVTDIDEMGQYCFGNQLPCSNSDYAHAEDTTAAGRDDNLGQAVVASH